MADSFDDDDFDEDDHHGGGGATFGKATAIYDFEATTQGSLSMTAHDQMDIVEPDNGDGWTRIRKANGEEGFVPTSYIQIN